MVALPQFPNILLVQKYIWSSARECRNAFDALQKYIFASHFVGAEHFTKENVQRTFSKGKCSAVQKCI